MRIGLVGFYGISTIGGHLMPNPLYTYILNIYDLVWFDLVLWHINHWRLFYAKSSLYIYIKYIWFGWVGFYGISTHCRLFKAKSSLYIYIKYIWFGWVGFYGISTIGVILCQILFIHIYWIYRIWFGWVLWHINHCRLFNAKSSLYIYIY